MKARASDWWLVHGPSSSMWQCLRDATESLQAAFQWQQKRRPCTEAVARAIIMIRSRSVLRFSALTRNVLLYAGLDEAMHRYDSSDRGCRRWWTALWSYWNQNWRPWVESVEQDDRTGEIRVNLANCLSPLTRPRSLGVH